MTVVSGGAVRDGLSLRLVAASPTLLTPLRGLSFHYLSKHELIMTREAVGRLSDGWGRGTDGFLLWPALLLLLPPNK